MTTRTLTPEQVVALKAQFDVTDLNKDGRITLGEVETLLRRPAYAHLDEVERQRILASYARVDVDGNGVDFDEFLTMWTEQSDPRAEYRKVFDSLDLDGDGSLTAEDFRRAAALEGSPFTQEEADSMIRAADANGDGKVSFDEYYSILTASSSG